MNREIWRLTIPNVVSNITVPLLGMADMAIAGRLGDAAGNIGALAIGSTIFNFLYWNCSFLRMGTGGLTAQAYGAGRIDECANLLVRALAVALLLAALLLALQRPLGQLSMRVMNADALVGSYFYARIWAVPAAIALFGLNGWFIGMQNSALPMCIALFQNVVNVACSVWFAFGLQMGIAGIAWGTVAAQYAGLAVAAGVLLLFYRRVLGKADLRESLRAAPLRSFFAVNRDIFLRSACLVAVFTFFTAASARMGDAAILAANALLMQLFTLYSYMTDGVAYAAEALTGRFVGAGDESSLRLCIRSMVRIGAWIALAFTLLYLVGWRWLLELFIDPSAADAATLLARAERYAGWIVLVPPICFLPFLLDGMMIGGTLTRILRNSMFLSIALFFGSYYALAGRLGNDALWLSFLLFMAARGLFQYLLSGRLKALYAKTHKTLTK